MADGSTIKVEKGIVTQILVMKLKYQLMHQLM
jgi:hypothetical protein